MTAGSQELKTPSLSVVLPYFLLSSASLTVISVLFFLTTKSVFSHYFQPIVLCITHVAVLGFITSIIFGSIYQMHTVVFEVNIYSELLAKISFACLLSGLLLLCISFYQFSIGWICQSGALLTLCSFLLFGTNIFLAIRKTQSTNLGADIISTSVIWLIVTGLIGVLLVFNFTSPFIPRSHLEILTIHAHTGFAGWILLLTIGVSSRVIPMFYLAEKIAKNSLLFAYILINAGLLLLSVTLYWELAAYLTLLSSLLLASGILCFLYFAIKAFVKRNREKFDTGMNLTSLSFLFLIAMLPPGILLSCGVLSSKSTILVSMLYGITFIIGFCGTLILGQALKIIPFLLWINKYQHLAENLKTPMPEDLIPKKAASLMSYLFLTGTILLCVSFALKNNRGIIVAAVFLSAASILFNYTIYKAVFHKH